MIIVSIICGILLMMTGFICMMRPGQTFFQTGYFMVILLMVFGIIGLVNVFKRRAHPISLCAHIPAIILGVFSLFRPGTSLIFDGIMIYLFACWFLLQGAISIYVSYRLRSVRKGWFLGALMGILAIILGIYSFLHPMIPVIGIGLLIGAYMIQAGLDMIVMATAVSVVKKELRK